MDFMSKFPSTILKNLSLDPNQVDVVVAPSTIHIGRVQQELGNSQVQLASQNCSLYGNGAYTGESSPQMLKDFGLNWVILGHSERRHVFGETDNEVGLKTINALNNNLNVIACIGEKLDEREAGRVDEVNSRQLNAIREHVEDWSNVVIAYEPVWAIGTGVVASTE